MAPSIADRFPSSVAGPPPSIEAVDAVRALRVKVVELAECIDALVPEGRDKSLALTHLEDAFYRSGRAVFFTGHPAGGAR